MEAWNTPEKLWPRSSPSTWRGVAAGQGGGPGAAAKAVAAGRGGLSRWLRRAGRSASTCSPPTAPPNTASSAWSAASPPSSGPMASPPTRSPGRPAPPCSTPAQPCTTWTTQRVRRTAPPATAAPPRRAGGPHRLAVRRRQQRHHRRRAPGRRRDDRPLSTSGPGGPTGAHGALPAGFGVRLDPSLRRPRPEVLIGGAPLRVLRLTPGGAALVDAWSGGQPVGSSPAAQALARRLLDGGLAQPDPDQVQPTRHRRTPRSSSPSGTGPAAWEATLNALGPAGPGVIVVDDGSDPPVTGPATARGHPAGDAGRGGRGAQRRVAGGGHRDRRVPRRRLRTATRLAPDPAPPLRRPGRRRGGAADHQRARPGTLPALAGYESGHSPLDLGDRPAPVRPGSRVPYVPTVCLAVRRVALEAAGGFDENLHFGEDVDLVWRLGKGGWRVGYEPAATVAIRSGTAWARGCGSATSTGGRPRHWPPATTATSPPSRSPPGAQRRGVWLRPVTRWPGRRSRRGARRRWPGGPARTRPRPGCSAAWPPAARCGPARGLAEGIRRAWLPPALGATAVLPPGRTRRFAASAVAVAFVLPAVTDWVRNRPPVGLPAWVGLRWADDLAYQAGVWAGALDARSGSALLPRW